MNWLSNFKPRMIIHIQYSAAVCENTYIVEAVCADRVFRVRHRIAVRNARGDEKMLKWLGGNHK